MLLNEPREYENGFVIISYFKSLAPNEASLIADLFLPLDMFSFYFESSMQEIQG